MKSDAHQQKTALCFKSSMQSSMGTKITAFTDTEKKIGNRKMIVATIFLIIFQTFCHVDSLLILKLESHDW